MLFSGQRPTLLNGITEVATRTDLLDRCLPIEAPRIDDERRRTDAELSGAFGRAQASVLGALLDNVVTALANVARVKLDRLPRMADFATWAAAADPADGEAFLRAYSANRASANTAALEASEVATHVLALVAEHGEIVDTSANLLRMLNERMGDSVRRHPTWPRDGRGFRAALTRIAPNLRAVSCDVTWGERGEYPQLRRWVRLRRSSDSGCMRPSRPSTMSEVASSAPRPPDGKADGRADGGGTVSKKAAKIRNWDGPDDPDGYLQLFSGVRHRDSCDDDTCTGCCRAPADDPPPGARETA